MEVRRWILGQQTRLTSSGGDDINAGLELIWRAAANGKPFAIGRKAVTSGAPGRIAGVNHGCLAARCGDCPNVAVSIKDQGLPISGPVRCFKPASFRRHHHCAAEVVFNADG